MVHQVTLDDLVACRCRRACVRGPGGWVALWLRARATDNVVRPLFDVT